VKAIIENNTIKDIAHTNPFEIYAPAVAELYDTDVPETASVGDELIDGVWVTPVVEEPVIEEYDPSEDENIEALSRRRERDELLKSSDWTQVADAPVDKAAWATYRQALRDITIHANFPNLEDSDWPVAP
jgi:hypothetical protein